MGPSNNKNTLKTVDFYVLMISRVPISYLYACFEVVILRVINLHICVYLWEPR